MGWFVSKDHWCAHYPGLDAELMIQSKTRRVDSIFLWMSNGGAAVLTKLRSIGPR
jgi:hypothetical protein